MSNNYIAFMAHIPHKHIDYIVNDLEEQQEIVTYLVGLETSVTVGEHLHFLCCVNSDSWYHKWSKKVFKDKFKLKGKAYKIGGKGYPRQYGKLKEIKDLEKMGSYTVKDGNIRTNMSENEIENFVKKSHKKSESLTMTYEIVEKMVEFDKTIYDTYRAYKTVERKVKPLTEDEKHFMKLKGQSWDWDFEQYREKELKVFIIKQLKEKNIESITKGKIDAIWHRFITLHFSPYEIYFQYYAR